MKEFWYKISCLGLDYRNNSLSERAIVLKNQINFVMLVAMLFFIVITTITREINGGQMTIGTFRLDLVFVSNLAIIILSRLKKHQLSKHFLIVLPSFFFIILPLFYNFIETETYFFNPLVIICFSIVIPLILEPKKQNKTLLFYSILYLILLVFNQEYFIKKAPETIEIFPVIKNFDVNYRLVPPAIFIFIHLAIHYLRNINLKYEIELVHNNNNLNIAINNLKKTQQQLIQSEKMASVGSLTSGVAHEINNPLNIIQGGIQILKKNQKNIIIKNEEKMAKVNTAIEMIEEGNRKASEIVASLMTFSFRGVSQLQVTNIHEIIDKTLLFLQVKITGDIEIIKNYELKKEVPVYMEKLHQVILNIIDNAIYVLQNNGINRQKQIIISTKDEGNYAQISIFNTGPHIEQELLNSIFDPFYTTKEPGKAAGLGLSISYSLISEHQGFLFAENKENGVAFTIKLPYNPI